MEESEIKFSVMVSLFNWIQKSKTSGKKRSKFRKFLDAYCHKPGDFFSSIRLILPGLDRERGSYGLKEHALATCLIDALGIARDSPDAQRLLNWRKGGPRTGATAGNFSLVAAEVLQRRQGLTSGGLTLKQLNEMLDRLSSSENRAEKASILSDLIRDTNANEMKWIVMIILKDLKLGISEKSIFHEFHPDAEDLFNVTCDLKLVCEKLRDRSQRHKRQDIEVGKAVRPQLALRVSNVGAAWKKLHGKEVVVECKFDGDRIQLHKNNSEVHFFSRNFLDHPEYEHAMSGIISSNILPDRCILDGEMLVWDTSENRFADFGSNQEIAKATREGLGGDRQLCYVAFDILYAGDTSVIHQSLKERHELLRKVVKPMKGRLEILLPDGGPNGNRQSGESCRSFVARSVEEVEKFFKDTVENRDEGIILKDLGSKWEPSDRSGKWLKLKPEYVRAGADLDALIIGGYYGSGRHGGKVAQFLVGLAERSLPNMHPKRFISFCRVGTGLSDEELETVVNKLQPYFRKYEYPRKSAPSFYEVTNNSKERPDVWIESPEKSIILSITSDIRTIKSEVFSAPYTLRFPRIDRVRFDKPWYECLDVKTFVELVHSSNGTTQRGQGPDDVQDDQPKRTKSTKKVGKNASVPTHFIQTDVSTVKNETLIFLKLVFYFVNVPSTHSLDLLHKMVVENGGTFSMNLNNSATHCIAAESKGIRFQAAKLRGDVIHYSWLLDCCSLKKLLPLQPKYFLHLSESSKNKVREEIDENSDSYFVDVDAAEIKQLLSNINRVQHSEKIDHYKKKYCPKAKWAHFHDCSFYFIFPQSLMKSEWKVFLELALRRMKVAVTFGGGKVTDNQHDATHVIVFSSPQSDVDYNLLLCCVTEAEKRLLMSKRIHVLAYQWLEVCIDRRDKVSEELYSIKPVNVEQLSSEKSDEVYLDKLSNLDEDVPNTSSSKVESARNQATSKGPRLITMPKKRGRPSGSGANRGRAMPSQPRRVRARVGNKPAKINEGESDGSISPVHSSHPNVAQIQTTTVENHEPAERPDVDVVKGKAVEPEASEHRPADEARGKPDVELQKDMAVKPDASEHKRLIDEARRESPDFELLKGKAVKPDVPEHKCAEEAHGISPRSKNGAGEDFREEMTADPVQIGNTRASPEYKVSEGGKLAGEASGLDSTFVGEEAGLDDPNQKPAKKKKVSYKYLAGELLKDW